MVLPCKTTACRSADGPQAASRTMKKNEKKKLENELRGYAEEPSYLKRQVREIELKLKKLVMGAE